MTVPALALTFALPFSLAAGDEQSLFHLPGEGDFRIQAVSRAESETDWPFAAAEGYLACTYVFGQRQVYFIDKGALDPVKDRALSISSDPFQMAFVNLGRADGFAPNKGLEDLLRRVGPFVAAGQRLCDQPRGATIGPGEL